MKLLVSGFHGENRALHPMLVPDGTGVLSLNQNPVRGDLRPWKSPATVATVPAGRQSIYRLGRDVAADDLYWLSWPTEVHAVKGFLSDDTTERTYYTGDGFPKWTDNVMGVASAPYPTAWRQLGVPAPTAAPILTVLARVAVVAGSFVLGTSYTIVSVGTTDFTTIGAANNTVGTVFKATGAGTGTGTVTVYNTESESRYYTYTFVTDKGEESAPGPVSAELVCKTDDTVAISSLTAAPSGSFGIDRIRIYRTQSGQTGATDFFFLREVAIGTTDTTDDGRLLGEVVPTDGWLMPPADLKGLTSMWNGMMAGISGNSVRVCEAYTPYAWPIAYDVIPPNATPVALARFEQNLLVLTTGRPVIVTGGSPDALDETPMDLAEACVAPRSVVSFGHGVAWACPDGLAYYGASGPKIITAGLMTRDDWQAIKPESIVASVYEGAYLGFYTVGGVTKGFLVDPLRPAGIFFMDLRADALYFDEIQDALFLLDGTDIKKWDTGTPLTATFRSKQMHTPKPTSFACAEVVADAYPVSFKLDAINLKAADVTKLIAAFPMLTAPTATSLRYFVNVPDGAAFRLPGVVAQDWQLELATSGAVQGAAVAQSMAEIATV